MISARDWKGCSNRSGTKGVLTPSPKPFPTTFRHAQNNYMTRAEHLQWCKDRAMVYVQAGDNAQALASMCSDLDKHPETRAPASLNQLALQLMMGGWLETKEAMARWIQGYN